MRAIRFDKASPINPDTEKTTTVLFNDATGVFRAGFWSSRPGKSEIHYQKSEMCVLIEGEVRLTSEDGTVETFHGGDTFVIPKGFKGTWETVKPTRKFFAVHQPA